MAFRGLQAESVAQGQAHHSISKELDTLVADPFDEWAQGYKVSRSRSRQWICLIAMSAGASQANSVHCHR